MEDQIEEFQNRFVKLSELGEALFNIKFSGLYSFLGAIYDHNEMFEIAKEKYDEYLKTLPVSSISIYSKQLTAVTNAMRKIEELLAEFDEVREISPKGEEAQINYESMLIADLTEEVNCVFPHLDKLRRLMLGEDIF
jgi:tetratricopeptide (TPR) repeat protein